MQRVERTRDVQNNTKGRCRRIEGTSPDVSDTSQPPRIREHLTGEGRGASAALGGHHGQPARIAAAQQQHLGRLAHALPGQPAQKRVDAGDRLAADGQQQVAALDPGPRRRAGIEAGDLLLTIGGLPVTGVDALLRWLTGERVGAPAEVLLLRRGDPRRPSVVPTERS